MDSRTIDSGEKTQRETLNCPLLHEEKVTLFLSVSSWCVLLTLPLMQPIHCLPLFYYYCMNPLFSVMFSLSSPTCLIFRLPVLFPSFLQTAPLYSVMSARHGTVYLWPRLFKFICGCQMSESLSLLSGPSLPPQTTEYVCIMFPYQSCQMCVCVCYILRFVVDWLNVLIPEYDLYTCLCVYVLCCVCACTVK